MPQFPFLTLLVSGGHTLIVLANSLTSFRILATTLDEAIGRTFDKISRMLQLDWTDVGPGAALEKFCAAPEEDRWPDRLEPFPRPTRGRLDFSYASLHSHLERYLSMAGGVEAMTTENKRAIARAFQSAAFAQLEEKLILAFKWCAQEQIAVRHLVVSGGVASNSYLRERYDLVLMWYHLFHKLALTDWQLVCQK